MTLRRFELPKSLLSILLVASLASGEMAQQAGLPDSCKENEHSCACLMERVGSLPEQAGTLTKAPQAIAPHREPRLVDLSAQPSEAARLLKNAQPTDIFILDQAAILDNSLLEKLSRSRATYVMKSNKKDLDSLRKKLAEPIGKPEYTVAIPTDDLGVQNVFGVSKEHSAAAVSYLSRLYWEYKKDLPRASLLHQSAALGRSIADDISARASAQTVQSLFVVVAHNRQGSLRFPDGSALQVSKLQDLLTARGRPGLILSCDTVRTAKESSGGAILTGKSLDFGDIKQALSNIERTSQNKAASFGDALLVSSGAISGSRVDQDRVVVLAFAVIGLLIVGGSVYFWMCNDRTDNKC